ncbi:MAG TPA: Ig-like domain-containing protein [Armatimonadota bacterium]|nr:Ig-like domain-containing protein [Armatimonadota bacterium]HOS43824.1 Ig-like domain-containing protein [Armatimonadota bacterium]
MHRNGVMLLAAACGVLGLLGCGGASRMTGESPLEPGGGTGTLTVTINWPEPARGRLMHEETASVVIIISYLVGEAMSYQQTTVNRPAETRVSTVSFRDIPPGAVTYYADGYTGADGAGLRVGTANNTLPIDAGQQLAVTLDLNLLPADYLNILSQTNLFVLKPGETLTLLPRACTVGPLAYETPVRPSVARWSSANPAVATVGETDGVVRSVAAGETTITLTDGDRGLTATTPIYVYDSYPNPGGDARMRVTLVGETYGESLQYLFTFRAVVSYCGQLAEQARVRWDWEDDGVYDTPYLATETIEYQYYTRTRPGVVMTRVQAVMPDRYSVSAAMPISLYRPLFWIETAFSVTPGTGDTGTRFTFNAGGMENGQVLPTRYVRWDWENDGLYDTPFIDCSPTGSWQVPPPEPPATHRFAAPGRYTVRAQLKSYTGAVNTDFVTVVVTP